VEEITKGYSTLESERNAALRSHEDEKIILNSRIKQLEGEK
jgi:hypothetical protein